MLKLAIRLLQRRGHTVFGASDGDELLALAKSHAGRLRLVLLDMSMPRLDGASTLARLRARGEQVPVVLTSGYTEKEVASRITAREGIRHDGYLQKPWTPRDLDRLLETLGLVDDAGE